jgi:hypothetical protein
VQQHQSQQPEYVGLVGHQLGERGAEADRLRGELAAAVIALVEDQVDDRQYRCQAVGQQMRGRDPEGDPCVPDLALGPHEPLSHGRLGHEKGASDLIGGEAAECAQRQRHLGVERQRGVAAGEDQLQPLVTEGALLDVILHGFGHLQEP